MVHAVYYHWSTLLVHPFSVLFHYIYAPLEPYREPSHGLLLSIRCLRWPLTIQAVRALEVHRQAGLGVTYLYYRIFY